MLNVVIDISHHQANVDFNAVAAAGIVGVIHKATAGTSFVDNRYAERKPRALAAGLLWGAYHWGVGDATAAAQAAHFLAVAQPDAQTLLALDYEPNVAGSHRLGPDMTTQQASQFVEAINTAHGRYPLLYTGLAMAGHIPDLPQCPLWWAGYSHAPHGIPATWPTWTLWQYTGDGLGPQPHTVDGIAGPIDRDQFNGDLDGLKKLWVP
ncbi:MAG: hypothetical protein QOC96_3216 [Acidobacteriota bacterium]|jgi:lysozyme|nr:hypothetical protein [Acidobacteriota bacterium]